MGVVTNNMRPLDGRTRRTGIAVLVAISLVTGFFVATTATGEEYTTVGMATDDNQAYQFALMEDQRVQMSLDAGDGDRTPAASFAVYDPEDAFVAAFDLQDSESVELIADEAGDWVLFVTSTTNAQLAVQYANEDADEAEDVLEEIPVSVSERVIASQDEGALDDELVVRIDPRPAAAHLAVDGEYETLDAVLSTDKGIVHAIEGASANETQDGAVQASQASTLDPSNLLAGTYHVEAAADAFDGEIVLVHHAYERDDVEAPEEVPDPLEDLTVVAEAQEHEAHEIDVAGFDEVALAVDPDTRASVIVYDANHTAQDVVQLEGERSYNHHNESQQADGMDLQVVSVDSEAVTVFVQSLRGDGDAVKIALATSEDVDRTQQLEIAMEEVTFAHENESQTANVTLDGGLVGVGTDSRDSLSMEREVTITGPQGEIAHIQENFSTFGFAWWYNAYDVNEENFSAGEIDIAFEQDSLLTSGETRVHLAHYVPS